MTLLDNSLARSKVTYVDYGSVLFGLFPGGPKPAALYEIDTSTSKQ